MSEADAKRPRTLRAGLRLVLAVAALLLLVGTTATFGALIRLQDDADGLVDGISPARISAATLATAYVDQQAGIRGYVLGRDEAFLAPYRAGEKNAVTSAATVRELVGDRREVAAVLDRLAAAGAAWRTEYAERAIAAVRKTERTAEVKLNERAGKVRFDLIRVQIDQLNATLAAERVLARNRLNDDLGRIRLVSALALGAVLVAGILTWLSLRRLVLGPLDRLSTEAGLVATGDFERRVVVNGPAEIRAVGANVEGMRQQMVAALTVSVQAEREVRVQADLLAAQTAELASRTEELAEQAVDLRRSNEDLEQFAYVASHDLQEPLRKVASFCQMLQRRYSGQLDERADQYIEFAVDGAKRMQLLINDLLAFSRVGRSSIEMTDVDCGEVAGQALAALSVARKAAKARVELGELPTVRGDGTLLTQLFQNLIGNAIKFHAPERAPQVRISAELEGVEWHFRCEDNGIGIEPEYADRVFVIFQRLHGKDAYTGTGIGLSLCKKIVEYHGGRIWLDTERTEGTMVHWTLQATDAENPAGADPEREATAT